MENFDLENKLNNYLNSNSINNKNLNNPNNSPIPEDVILAYSIVKCWNVLYGNDPFKIMDNLRLQKTMYFLYGLYYGTNNKKEIIKNPNFNKWKLGPVVKSVYYQVKYLGNRITPNTYKNLLEELYDNKSINKIEDFYKEHEKNIKHILKKISIYNVFDLVEKSHRTEPWEKTSDSEKIDVNLINKYFEEFTFEKFENL